ncbi:3',5'-cyclic AMP phosphodiesterase CpdA [Mucilaginibacter yixingensis]|uniref:acid phosphatase n=1 Tax=Mucilaginibacter yixingensis TaxID=1295612 RepID=A0A2T5JB76_9SPHI|nr:tartrate-resistant acid phosphatase type 5 family protein [Mucilaginibacter yixingensis]PTQ98122.1 3',5'-cyclic AMP phosphodiesterase CpdA [Mucilaginibacter yixingensis]
MNRREFVKNTAITALAGSMIAPIEALAEPAVTHLESADLSAITGQPNGYPLNFLAIGDWGRNGEYNQAELAVQMGDWAKNHPTDFIISAGDNIYPKGVVSEMDPAWHYSFEDVFKAHSLQVDWFAILGNHDYYCDPDAQVRYSKVSRRWNMPARYYKKEVSLGNNNGKVLFLMIDTQPIIYNIDSQHPTQQLEWIDKTLQEASADVKWKIVVGHHPAYTAGPRINNYDTLSIRKALAPILVKNKVDLYLSGHDHSLQHLKPNDFVHQFISGAGSELTQVSTGVPDSRFEKSENGYMYFSVNSNEIAVKAISYKGEMLYETSLKKA